MAEHLAQTCEVHPDPSDCPDALVGYITKFDEYGIRVHNGGSSMSVIDFCPWCGAGLPASRRREWFETLERLGFDDPSSQDIPPEFKTDAWWRDRSPEA